MPCPKCSYEHAPHATECPRCGVVFAKYAGRTDAAVATPVKSEDEQLSGSDFVPRQEMIYRLLAVPSALFAARVLVAIAPAAVRILSMWIHESGHAFTAWLCGYWALPGPWFTPVGAVRSRMLTIFIAGLISFGIFRSWKSQRWRLVSGGVVLLMCQFVFTFGLYSDQAQQLIVFGGDAGCFVLGTGLMITFYVRRESAIYENGLRWAFLTIGALSFMDAFAVWSGGMDRIPFGENENGLSDPSVLTELYGWSAKLLMARYYRLALSCFIALGIAYAAGLAVVFPKSTTRSHFLAKGQTS